MQLTVVDTRILRTAQIYIAYARVSVIGGLECMYVYVPKDIVTGKRFIR